MTEQKIYEIFSGYDKNEDYISDYLKNYGPETKATVDERKLFFKENALIHPLETMALMDKYEKENIYAWSKEFYPKESILELYGKFIQRRSEVTIACLQFLLILFKHLPKQELEEMAYTMFSDENRREEKKGLSAKRMSQIYAAKIAQAYKNMPSICYWKDSYARIVLAILNARENDYNFPNSLERHMRHQKFTRRDKRKMTPESFGEYYVKILNAGADLGANYFADRVYSFNEDIFGWDIERCRQFFLACPSPRIVWFGYYYLSERNPEYTEELWYEEVKLLNHDENTLTWLKLHMYYRQLWLYAKEKDFSSIQKMVEAADSLKMFDIEKCNYMTRMVSRMAETINELVFHNQDVLAFLKKIEPINVYSYAYNEYISDYIHYIKENSGIEESAYNVLKKKLFEVSDPEVLLYLYMNTHMKMRIDIRDVIEHLWKKMKITDREKMQALFAPYKMTGVVTYVSKKDAIRNRIYIDPICPYTQWTFKNAEKVKAKEGKYEDITRDAYNKIMRNDFDWCKNNMDIAELIKEKDHCSFYISDYDASGYIYVCNMDKEDFSEDEKQREEFPNHVREWLQSIQNEKKLVQWPQDIRVFNIRYVKDREIKKQIALDILETVLALVSQPKELELFIKLIYNTYPTEGINELLYIQKQHFCNDKDEIIEEMIPKALELGHKIFAARDISPELKLAIYQNTCLKRVYRLENACRYFGEGVYSMKHLFPLRIKRGKGGKPILSPNYRDQVISSKYEFVYEDIEKIPIADKVSKNIYSFYLKGVDFKERKFFVEKVFVNPNDIDKWDNFIHNLFDFKRQLTEEHLAGIQNKLDELSIAYTDNEKIRQYSYELERIFAKYRYRKGDCVKVLKTLGRHNFYENDDEVIDAYVMSDEDKVMYRDVYQLFLKTNKDIGYPQLCYIYYRTFFRKVVSKEELWQELKRAGEDMEEVKRHCIKEGYLKA